VVTLFHEWLAKTLPGFEDNEVSGRRVLVKEAGDKLLKPNPNAIVVRNVEREPLVLRECPDKGDGLRNRHVLFRKVEQSVRQL
jgi:hypothetical protein